jgi:hypothetical protein
MDKVAAILYLFPNAINHIDFEVRDDMDGRGPYIDIWNLPEPQPTEEELAAAWIEFLKKKKIEELAAACNAACLGYFSSSALGSPHYYSSDSEAQTNFNGAVNLINAGLLQQEEWTCYDENWNRLRIMHTKEKILQVFVDGSTYRSEQTSKYNTLLQQVNAATTEEEIAAITWEVTDGTTAV